METLPIDAALPPLLAALRERGRVVLEAPPGAGKTTRVPPALLDEVPGEILVLEPRRIAARSAARRVAQERGERLGETVGFQIRFEEVAGPRTRIRFVTEGILARRLLADATLKGVSAVVLDEFHERHLPGDLALALLAPRRDLKLVVMSATLDAAPLAAHLDAPVVRSEGRRFPVDVEYLEREDDRWLQDQVAAAVRKLTVPGTAGDVLVFLPGAGEIRQCLASCAELAAARDLLLLPLHGELPGEEQDRALAPAARRKVIFSTNVAETSVTVPGVTAVIDTGLARIAGHSPWSGLPSLQVQKISRASAEQRAGRAGRLAPGRCLRLYTRHDFASRPEHHAPEVERLDLAAAVLELRAAGHDPERLAWLDPPPPGALQAANALLERLGCVQRGAVTEVGRLCARLPVHPRLARIAVEAALRGLPEDGAALAAVLSEREASRSREPAPTGPSDVLDLADRFDAKRYGRAQKQLLRELPRDRLRKPRDESLLLSVLTGFPDRVAKRRGAEVLLSQGGAAQLSPLSAVRDRELMVAVDAEERRDQGRARAVVRLASAIEAEWLLDLYPDELREEVELVWEEQRQRVEVISRLRYGALALEESRHRPGAAEALPAAELLLEHARGVPDPALVASLQARSELVAQHCPEAGIAALTGEAVRAAAREAARGLDALADLQSADFTSALLAQVGPRAVLDRLAPEHVTLPGGRRAAIEYTRGQPPALHSRLQDFFGMSRGPAVCDGRVPVTLHLLAPNGRAQQVTQDLAGFWERHYPAVRKELMRRYPRHSWPEDGATAQPPPPRRR